MAARNIQILKRTGFYDFLKITQQGAIGRKNAIGNFIKIPGELYLPPIIAYLTTVGAVNICMDGTVRIKM